MNSVEGISPELLHRYLVVRCKIYADANSIFGITSMLALLSRCGNDKIKVDPVALGKINQMLNTNILNIWEILDEFIYMVQAQAELERLKNCKIDSSCLFRDHYYLPW